MISLAQQSFLAAAYRAATEAAHIFPDMAACEAALESNWGASALARDANNLFGLKQQQHPEYGTVYLPTREFLNAEWVRVDAAWAKYPDWKTCFMDRIATLRRLADSYPHYAFALEAKSATDYVDEVSLSWSTDPSRAGKVRAIWNAHAAALKLVVI